MFDNNLIMILNFVCGCFVCELYCSMMLQTKFVNCCLSFESWLSAWCLCRNQFEFMMVNEQNLCLLYCFEKKMRNMLMWLFAIIRCCSNQSFMWWIATSFRRFRACHGCCEQIAYTNANRCKVGSKHSTISCRIGSSMVATMENVKVNEFNLNFEKTLMFLCLEIIHHN